MRCVWLVARIVEVRKTFKILAGKLEGKRPLGKPGIIWEDNIRMDPRELGWLNVNWTDLIQDSYQWLPLVNFGFHKRREIFLTS
jgi:hypothetical protein